MARNVSLLGLNDFGEPVGLHPLLGVLIGGGFAAGAAAVSRIVGSTTAAEHADGIGFGIGSAAAGSLFVMGENTRGAGWGALLGAFLATGISALTKLASKSMNGIGVPVINQLGLPQVNYLQGLGIATVANTAHAYGTVPGVAGLAQPAHMPPPVNLLGSGSALGMQAQMLAGPTLQAPHGLASAYGANLFGGH